MNWQLCFSVVVSAFVITKTQASSNPISSCGASVEVKNLSTVSEVFNIRLEWTQPDDTSCVEGYIIYLNDTQYGNTTTTNMEITNLHACETYNVAVGILSGGKEAGTRVDKSVKTIAPSPFDYSVQDLGVNQTSPNELFVIWIPPADNVAKCVTTYQLEWWDNKTKTHDETIKAPQTYFELGPLIGCLLYTFQVKPQVGANDGHTEQIEFTSEPQVQNAPIISQQITRITDTDATFETDSKEVNRCPLHQIIVTCHASDELNTHYDWIIKEGVEVVNVTTQSPSYRYSVTVSNLSPFTNYSCFCLVTNEAGNSSATPFDVKTGQDVPSEPESLNITNLGAYSFTIQWEKPHKIPTILQGYGLWIIGQDSAYIFNQTCYENGKTVNFDFGPTPNSFVYEQAVPYYTYQVKVYAISSAGNGSSATIEPTTLPSEPEQVQNPNFRNFNYLQTEDYQANAVISFDPPCNTYGVFEHYQICWTGKRRDFKVDDNCITTHETTVTIPLQAERNYTVSVSVITEHLSSTVYLPEFISKTGVPLVNGNLIPPTSQDSSKSNFTFSKQSFSNANGEILYYALILLPRMDSLQTTYGFWDGTTVTWPSVPISNVTSKKSEPRHLTVPFWNPFASGADTVHFEIGNLTDDSEYSLIVRALTRVTYKDSPLLNFKTVLLFQMDLSLVQGLTYGLSILLILLIVIYLKPYRHKVEKKPPLVLTSSWVREEHC